MCNFWDNSVSLLGCGLDDYSIKIHYLQGKEYFSITSKLGQVKPHYHPPGFTPQGVKMSAAPSINPLAYYFL